jgi:hypothetical protein
MSHETLCIYTKLLTTTVVSHMCYNMVCFLLVHFSQV